MSDIVWKEEVIKAQVPYCPVCKEKLHKSCKDYRPYWCKCGDWYWNDEDENYDIYKQN